MEQQLSIVPTISPTPDPLRDPYHSAMVPAFGHLHQHLFPPFFRDIAIEGTPLAQLRQLAADGTIIFVTPQIGQFEYHFFNWLFLEHALPLAHYGHGLATPGWLPLREQWHLWRTRVRSTHPPHPIRSGHVQRLIANGQAVLLRVKTSRLYDDRFWESLDEDPLRAVIEAGRQSARPCYVIPLQFLWDKRPERTTKSVIDLLLGSRHSPTRLRKLISFWRGYKTRMVTHIGEPIPLQDVFALHPHTESGALTDLLRERLLAVFQRERKGTTGPKLKPRRWMIEQTVQDTTVQKLLYELAREKQTNVEDLQHLAHKYACEIAADVNYEVAEIMQRIVMWIVRTIYNGVVVDEASMATIRQALSAGPIALVPNHRSHMDYLLLSALLYEHNVALPYVAGGLNMAFWPFGWIARSCGAFFLRRSFRGNALYRAVFAAYLTLLVHEGHCVEFFIEGGRSRTGKSLKPRMGILSMLGKAMQAGAAPDLRFVPVSITYDQVPEQGAYLNEIAGGEKRPESFWEMLRLRKHFRRRYGRIYVNVGTPLSYGAAIELSTGRACAATALTPEDHPKVTQFLATALMREINKSIVVTPAALTATALLMYDKPALTETEIHTAGLRLHHYLHWKGVPCSQLVAIAPLQALREAVALYVKSRILQRHDSFAPLCYVLERDKRALLDLNKNTIAHYAVSLSCVSAILLRRFGEGPVVSRTTLEADFRDCQTLFQNEFVFATREAVGDHIDRVLEYLASLHATTDTPSAHEVRSSSSVHLRFFAELLQNYFEAYWVVFHGLQQLPPATGDDAQRVLLRLRGLAEHLLRLGVLKRSEAISQITFQNALKTFKTMGIFQGDSKRDSLLQQQLEGLARKAPIQQESTDLSTMGSSREPS